MSLPAVRIYALFPLIVVAALSGCRSSDSEAGPDAGTDDNQKPLNIEVCAQSLPSVVDGVCDVASGTGSAVVIHGDVLGEGVIYENGSVVYEGQKITCVGCDCSGTAGFDTATVLSCAGAAISPGLINPHDHITFTEGSPISVGN